MMTPGATLLQRSPLGSGESLRSLLARLAHRNLMTLPAVHRLCFPPAFRPMNTVAPWEPDLLEHIAGVTGVATEQVRLATPHRFGQILYEEEHLFPSFAYGVFQRGYCAPCWYKFFAMRTAAWFCPACLLESPFHRLLWDMVWVGCCLKHECLLLDHCPTCGKKSTIDAVVAGRCRRCQHPYSEQSAWPCPAASSAFQVQWLMTQWMESPQRLSMMDAWGLPPWSLHMLLMALQMVVQQMHTRHWVVQSDHPQMLSQRLVQDWAVAMEVLSHWPQGIPAFWDRWLTLQPSWRYGLEAFDPLYHVAEQYAAAHPEGYAFAQALEAYVLHPHRLPRLDCRGKLDEDPAFAQRYYAAQQIALAQHYRTTVATIAYFQHGNLLPQCVPDATAPVPRWQIREEDEQMALAPIGEPRSVDQIAAWLHLAPATIQWWMHDRMTQEEGILPEHLAATVQYMLERCLEATPVSSQVSDEWLDLDTASRLLQWHGLSLEGGMRACWLEHFAMKSTGHTRTLDLRNYCVSRRRLLAYITSCCHQRVGLTSEELSTFLRIPKNVSEEYVQSGVFVPRLTICDTHHRWSVIPKRVVQQFQTTMLLGREVMQRWNTSAASMAHRCPVVGVEAVWQSSTLAPRYWIYRRKDIDTLAVPTKM